MTNDFTDNILGSISRYHEHIVILDIEHTCTEDGSIPREERETIEIGAVIIDTKSLKVIDQYSALIRPIRHPNISQFCTQLTSITQSDLDHSALFPDVFKNFVNWLPSNADSLIATWGAYDLVQINIDCAFHGLEVFAPKTVLNLKLAFKEALKLKKPVGLKKALELSLQSFSGKHHRGLDDAKNTAKLLPLIIGTIKTV